jgi:hypothetical protein
MNLSLDQIVNGAIDKKALERQRKIIARHDYTNPKKVVEPINSNISEELVGAPVGLPIAALIDYVNKWVSESALRKKDDVTTMAYLKERIQTFFEEETLKKYIKELDKVAIMRIAEKHQKLGSSIKSYIKEQNEDALEGMVKYFLKMTKEERRETMKLIRGESK